ncbi:bifunctional hydroxymethylpyrimidine kinase/phosphomethylpyrimidine kinase [uncultured Polaribacter sp.]|uniref:bifunctional hydroxymethylpyrimidine kinase/phosphomethylpyrimidine kinase n=1 Tax=uncultured Polaribacter sp. TaxID=174711 RepID=UPI0026140A2F|nr:bifunctional hydroxymethylpyrimidine kinase/phosphomethylpyrimidine kinase [uncultured Polaribacter sp.]
MKPKAYILTIAGLDPSSGAGITSDIKTFEAHNLYGLSVCTAVTVQNDTAFKACIWIEKQVILNQIKILFKRFLIDTVKIGIIESWATLLEVTILLKEQNPNIKIILDPVLKASAGFTFHSHQNLEILEKVFKNCFFITPNYDEIKALFPEKSVEETIQFITERTNLYLKGGHRVHKKGWDQIIYNKNIKITLEPSKENIHKISEKHGSGCVLSSSLAANLTQHNTIEVACKKTKKYIEYFLTSNTSLLGTHNYQLK